MVYYVLIILVIFGSNEWYMNQVCRLNYVVILFRRIYICINALQ